MSFIPITETEGVLLPIYLYTLQNSCDILSSIVSIHVMLMSINFLLLFRPRQVWSKFWKRNRKSLKDNCMYSGSGSLFLNTTRLQNINKYHIYVYC